ncbi:response regulator [Flavobacterium sp.]|uniref:response regulator n=1 Tax=Flavobacterium sp. TaxID=239 RepID=UPI002FDAA41B
MKKSVLIIDNDPIYLTITQKIIERFELADSIFIGRDGLESINLIKNRLVANQLLPEIILLDLEMPIMNGWEFLDEYCKIKDSFPNQVSIYIVSSSISYTDKSKAKNYTDVKDFFSKPVSIETLKEVLNS